jgi:3-oxoadipate enol-lactonase
MSIASRALRTAGWGLLGWAGWRLLGPEIVPHFPGRQEHPMPVPGRSVFVGQREMFVREAGPADGPPVVLIHGWAYDSVGTWHALFPILAERFRVIAVDQRNHGRSDWIRGPYSVADVADEVSGIMDAVGVGRSAVFGYSMGGMVAQELTRRHPDKVDRLILAGTAACPIPERRLAVRGAFAVGRALARFSLTEGSLLTRRYLQRTGTIRPEHERWMWQTQLHRDPTLYYEAGNAIWRFDSRDWVGKLEVPIMVVVNAADEILPPRHQYELAALIDGAELIEIPEGRHEAVWTHAEMYAAAIEHFLN